MEVTEAVREWDYGEYEGLTSKQIREMRREKGEGEWDIWRDGCPGGEYVYILPFIFFALFSLWCHGWYDDGGGGGIELLS